MQLCTSHVVDVFMSVPGWHALQGRARYRPSLSLCFVLGSTGNHTSKRLWPHGLTLLSMFCDTAAAILQDDW